MSFFCDGDGMLSKIITDPVHGHMTVHPLCVAIIDTPQFQRLRHIKQVGVVHYVYPGATHDRFGHSLGVSHLAGCFLRELRDRQPNLGITDREILCLEIAGLCHDLGHGPLSHTWEFFMRMRTQISWKHEEVSANLLDYLIEVNNLTPLMTKWGIDEEDQNFIKQIIRGETDSKTHRRFLYQIVNNEDSGLDVDKWDYFLRDSYYCGFPLNFNYRWLMQFARVINVDGYLQICFRDKEASNVYNMFRTRSYLYHTAYKHRVVAVIDHLISEVLCEADGIVTDLNGQVLQFSQWTLEASEPRKDTSRFYERMEKFWNLTDTSVLYAISQSKLPVAVKLKSIEEGRGFKNMYHYVGSCLIHRQPLETEVREEFTKFISKADESLGQNCIKDGFLLQVIAIHWGKGEVNPVDSVLFYSKDRPECVRHINKDEVSPMLPRVFQEVELRLFCPKTADIESFRHLFKLYCRSVWEKEAVEYH